ncbi:OmpA family protein [Desemzia sp. FAM 23991]|uniref:OmpA family protein n=1 Tax=unclassified Desemzia TaxID=2685243 RepID=UPI0038891E9C
MARKQKKKIDVESGGSPGWMTTFSDLMTLLLTFFILLFSMSSVSDTKFDQASASMSLAFTGQDGLLPKETTVVPDDTGEKKDIDGVKTTGDEIPPELVEMYEKMEQLLHEQDMDTTIGIEVDSEGIYLDIKDSILFSPGSADIVGSGTETLNNLAELIQQVDNEVIIEGYTDDVPMSNEQYDSNWELSTSRAVSVLRYLSEEKAVDPTRLSARGYGEHHPIVPNDSAKNRAENRRVNIVILYEEFEEGS